MDSARRRIRASQSTRLFVVVSLLLADINLLGLLLKLAAFAKSARDDLLRLGCASKNQLSAFTSAGAVKD
jgi:hypothetical protein